MILDLQTLFKVTVHLQLEAPWGWRMNQDGLRGGKTYAPDKWFRTDRLTDRLINVGHLQSEALTINGYKHLLHFPLNFFSLPPSLIKFSFEFSQANFPLILYNVTFILTQFWWYCEVNNNLLSKRWISHGGSCRYEIMADYLLTSY